MKQTLWPRGLVTAIVTPLRNDQVDQNALAALVEYQIAGGAGGLVVSGGTGEYSTLSLEERRELVRNVVGLVRGRVPVIAATGCLATRDALRLSADAAQSGAFGLLVASSYGEAISWQERLHFYRELDASVSVPILIYNTPPAGLLKFDQVRQLAELEHVTGVKDSSGDPELMGDLVDWAKPLNFAVYVGKDAYLYEAITIGATGAVFGAGNFMPSELSGLITRLQTDGAGTDSLAQWAKIRRVLRILEQASNYVGLCKAGCRLRGIDVGVVRPPYRMPDAREIDALTHGLNALA
jgi:4-hydroxy-tetrahydrodipicolinate synthase